MLSTNDAAAIIAAYFRGDLPQKREWQSDLVILYIVFTFIVYDLFFWNSVLEVCTYLHF